MTPDEYARRIVAGWPPLTVRQRELIQGLLTPAPASAPRAPKRKAA